MTQDLEGFGTLDGQPIDRGAVKLAGGAAVDRVYGGGERVVLIVEGVIADTVTVKRQDGRLVRVHSLKVESVAPPTDRLADEAASFLKAFTDNLDGKAALPFPGEGPEADGWTYDQPEPAQDAETEDAETEDDEAADE